MFSEEDDAENLMWWDYVRLVEKVDSRETLKYFSLQALSDL
jgi:hypothetical protein